MRHRSVKLGAGALLILVVAILLIYHTVIISPAQAQRPVAREISHTTLTQSVQAPDIKFQVPNSVVQADAKEAATSKVVDTLPADMTYYCNRVHYLGGRWPMHIYVGGCLVDNIKKYSWSVDMVKTVVDQTLCVENVPCQTILNVLAYFIHKEVTHVAAESAGCGGRGVYVHVFGSYFRTHPVCAI